MTVAPMKILSMRIRVRSLILFTLLIVYIGFSLCLFFQWIAPSLDGRTDQHIAADSTTYIYYADSIREGNFYPSQIAAFFSFPNTLVCPTLLALVFNSTFVMVIANYVMFFLALVLLKRSFSFSVGVFAGLLLLNATTTISLLAVNKEIVDLLAVSMFLFAWRKHRNGVLFLALLLALFNRFEVCIVMLLFMLVESKLNPWRRRRVVTLFVLIISLSILVPLLGPIVLRAHFEPDVPEQISQGQISVWFNALEMHYLYGVALIPKIAATFFSELINVRNWETSYGSSDIANTYILLSNNIATAVVFIVLAWKRKFTVRSDIFYFAMLGCIIMTISMAKQPRYLYFAYVLFCLQAAQTEAGEPSGAISIHKRRGRGSNALLPDNKEAAFG